MKILPNNVAVLEHDTHISRWVEKLNTLAIAEEMLKPFRQFIPEGGCVLDIGASIGDHTVTYAEWVGTTGTVVAFEPLPEAYECLEYNTKHLKQVIQIDVALSDIEHPAGIVRQDNIGASYLSSGDDVTTLPLDYFDFDSVSFIKIDAEGYETKILRGAVQTVKRSTPVMLIEVNKWALERAGSSSNELRDLILSLGYSIAITDPVIQWDSPQFDILCLPTEKDH